MATDYNWLIAKIPVYMIDSSPGLAAELPSLIELAEAEIKSRLQIYQQTQRAQGTVSAETVDLPADCQKIVEATILPSDKAPYVVQYGNAAQVREAQFAWTRVPRMYTITDGNKLKWVPFHAPAEGTDPYPYEITYYKRLVPLTASNLTNEVISRFPMVYLAGCVHQAKIWDDDLEGATSWYSKFGEAIQLANDDTTQIPSANVGANPLTMYASAGVARRT